MDNKITGSHNQAITNPDTSSLSPSESKRHKSYIKSREDDQSTGDHFRSNHLKMPPCLSLTSDLDSIQDNSISISTAAMEKSRVTPSIETACPSLKKTVATKTIPYEDPMKDNELKDFMKSPLEYAGSFNKTFTQVFTEMADETLDTQTNRLHKLMTDIYNSKQYSTYCFIQGKTVEEELPGKERHIELVKIQIDTIKAEQTLIEEIEKQPCFKHFDLCNLWKLAVDHKDHEKGKYCYESEPGYLKGYFKGLTLVLQQIRTGTFIANWENFLKIHQTATTGVENRDELIEQYSKDTKPTQFYGVRKLTKKFEQVVKKAPLQVMKIRHQDSQVRVFTRYIFRCINEDNQKYDSHGNNLNTTYEQRVHTIQEIFQEYSEKIQQAKTTQEKESGISVCSTELSRVHIFTDGNTRSVNILLMGLLLSNDLKPAVLCDPNCFDYYADSEILTEVQRGYLNFQALLKQDSPDYRPRDPAQHIEPEYAKPVMDEFRLLINNRF